MTVVLAHYALTKGQVGRAVQYVGITLALGTVFLVIKGFEYNAKFQHGILPGLVFDRLDGKRGIEYIQKVRRELKEIEESKYAGPAAAGCQQLAKDLEVNANGQARITPIEAAKRVKGLLEEDESLHLTPQIPFGNLWASCYFAMTGFQRAARLRRPGCLRYHPGVGRPGPAGSPARPVPGADRSVLAFCRYRLDFLVPLALLSLN